jgi:hypothetical protein
MIRHLRIGACQTVSQHFQLKPLLAATLHPAMPNFDAFGLVM